MDIKNLKKNRTFSYICVAIGHIIAIIVGVVIGRAMTGEVWVNFLVASLVSMVIIFIFSCVFKNNSFFTPFWGALPLVAVFTFAFSLGLSVIRFLMLVVIAAWGVNSVVNWARDFKGLRKEDWRTVMARKKMGSLFPAVNFIVLFLIPTLILFLCMLPVALLFSEEAEFSVLSVLFILIAAGGLAIEAYSNYHMHLFRIDREDGYENTEICRYGLWSKARHPNYFGEMIFWWGIAIAVIFSMPSKWYVFIGPLILTASFYFVGVPLMEGHLRTKAGHTEYFRFTKKLVPLPGKGDKK